MYMWHIMSLVIFLVNITAIRSHCIPMMSSILLHAYAMAISCQCYFKIILTYHVMSHYISEAFINLIRFWLDFERSVLISDLGWLNDFLQHFIPIQRSILHYTIYANDICYFNRYQHISVMAKLNSISCMSFKYTYSIWCSILLVFSAYEAKALN